MKVSKKVGILGGGQLARMLILEGHRLGLEMHVLCAQSSDPAAQVTSFVTLGSIEDPAVLKAFVETCDVVTFESEFIDTRSLEPLRSPFFPSLSAIATIQDRLSQKALLDQHKIPTARWLDVKGPEALKQAAHEFKRGFVLKKRRFGYDGYGTFIVKKLERKHFELIEQEKAGFIAEEFVAFKRELATTLVRSSNNHQFLPLVETKQVDSRCLWVKGPVKHASLSRLKKSILSLARALDYRGALAFEIFETSVGLFVNELAPRVHNSAHYSLDALNMSQFELHLRAGLNWELPSSQPLGKGFAMVNLLGENHAQVKLSERARGRLHWYGKGENKKGRKLGHITTLGASADAALKEALDWRKDFVL